MDAYALSVSISFAPWVFFIYSLVNLYQRTDPALLRQHLRGVLALEGVSDPRGALVESAVTTCSGEGAPTHTRVRCRLPFLLFVYEE